MLKKKEAKSAGDIIEKVIKKALESLPATQKWVSFDDLRKAAEKLDDDKNGRKH